jgi:glycine hydroxymethyltransferase
MFSSEMTIAEFDPELSAAIKAEARTSGTPHRTDRLRELRQPACLEAQGSVLTNKYAEGYPGKRYYGGCEHVDVVEKLAIDRAKAVFGADYANVQPHSGSQANAAVYMALLKPGDTVLGMSLATAATSPTVPRSTSPASIYNSVQYGSTRPPARSTTTRSSAWPNEHKPKMIMAGFSAYSRVIDWQRFRAIADKVGAWFCRHGPRRRPGGGRAVPQPGADCRRRHHLDHAQDPARPARRPDSGQAPTRS